MKLKVSNGQGVQKYLYQYMRSFITADINQHYFEALKRYYVASEDKSSKIVDFSAAVPSLFLRGSECIAEGKEDFTIIDSFNGKMPTVLNYSFLVEQNEAVPFLPGMILDSNVVSYLHSYVKNDRSFRNTARGLATHRVLRRISERSQSGWDFSALFYLLESVSKVALNTVFPHAQALQQSIVQLQLMDNDAFIKSGRIVLDSSKHKEYIERHGAVSLDVVSADHVNWILSSGLAAEVRLHVQSIYSTLLKISVLSSVRLSNTERLQLLLDFFQNSLGAFLAREAIVACLQFAGKAGKFLSIKHSWAETKRNMLASAWDLFLLRFPELVMSNEGPDCTSMYYVCTAEKVLQNIRRMFVVRRVSSLREGVGTVPTSVGIRLDLLEQEIGEELTDEFANAYSQFFRSAPARTPATLQKVLLLISDLEQQVEGLTLQAEAHSQKP